MGYTLEQKVIVDFAMQTRPIPVQDGKWVVPLVRTASERTWQDFNDGEDPQLEESTWSYAIVGPEPTRHLLDRHNQRSRGYSHTMASYALVGDRPFGVILTQKENSRERFGQSFVCARQVHKGESGQRPKIPRPRFAREAHAAGRFDSELPLTRDRRRGYVCWAGLDETAYLIGMGPEELVRRYFRFTHSERPALDVVFADDLAKLHKKPPQAPMCFGADALPALFTRDPSTIWIRKGFACTALYLHHLGYVPDLHPSMMSLAELVRETSVIVP